jgi:hypothetical protein
VGDVLSYLCESRPWVEKIIVIAHNAKTSDLHFILNRAILMKWQVELIMKGMKIMCMRVEHLVFLDSVSFLPFALLKLPKRSGYQSPSHITRIFKQTCESRLCRKNPRHILWRRRDDCE